MWLIEVVDAVAVDEGEAVPEEVLNCAAARGGGELSRDVVVEGGDRGFFDRIDWIDWIDRIFVYSLIAQRQGYRRHFNPLRASAALCETIDHRYPSSRFPHTLHQPLGDCK